MGHNADMISIHKCRRCGELIEGVYSNKRAAAEITAELVVNQLPPNDIEQAPLLVDFHFCKDGGIGVTDFIGWDVVKR